MSLYAIGDLHLHFQAELKAPGQMQDPVWKNHETLFKRNCETLIRPEDTLVLAGDHSWGRKMPECEKDLERAGIPEGSTVLLEDLVNLTANEMFDGGDVSRIVPALEKLSRRCRHLVMVTNDLFSDGAAYSDSVQDYLRKLAAINRQAAAMADCVVEVVYSIPVALKGDLPCV